MSGTKDMEMSDGIVYTITNSGIRHPTEMSMTKIKAKIKTKIQI